jgi:colicin import membrane protein
MAEMRESSVLFSLNQLMHLEQQRVREEDEGRRRAIEASERARLDAERQRAVEQEERIRAEEERQRAEEAARREEEVRHEAIRVAAREKARIEAEQRARIAEMELAQKHERDLAAVQQDAQKRRLQRTLIIGGALAVALLGGGAGLYFGKLQPEAERAQREQAAQIAKSEAGLTAAKDAYDKAVRDADTALTALRAANDEAARLKAQQAVDAANQLKIAAKGRLTGVQRTAGGKTTGGDGCVCEHPGDPMCGCLNR